MQQFDPDPRGFGLAPVKREATPEEFAVMMRRIAEERQKREAFERTISGMLAKFWRRCRAAFDAFRASDDDGL